MSTPPRHIVVTDANVLVNLMRASQLGLLAKIPNYEFAVPDHAREEITIPKQRTQLDHAVFEGWLKVAGVNDPGAITVFTELIAHLGRGEAACIAIAATRGWLIASDEKKRFLHEATARVGGGCVITNADIFALAGKAGLLTANADKVTLKADRSRCHSTRIGN